MLPAIDTVTDAELDRMVNRAYREAARSHQEARQCSASIAAVLKRVALDADHFWAELRDEQRRRERQESAA